MAKTTIKPLTPALAFLTNLIGMYSTKAITIPADFREQGIAVDELLSSDSSGLINSLLDFAISSGCVDFTVETSNKTLTNTLNEWLLGLNSSLRGKIPVGVDALAKEYYRERWKGSSFVLLRTIWEDVDGFNLPTKLWFVDGKDLEIVDDPEQRAKRIGEETYQLIISKDKRLKLPALQEELDFVQKPYERWSADYPVPFIIKRGIYYNAKFLQLITDKGSNVINKALEYLMLLKKGNVDLAKLGKSEFIYSEDDLKKVKDDFQELVNNRTANNGIPNYTTNFDTEIEHLIPEYEKALKSGLYSPVERRILAGLGFIEVVEGITSTRKDAILNPKVFVSEVKAGVDDFKSLLTDVLMTIIERNRGSHKKLTNTDMIQIRTSPIKNFYSDDLLQFLRSMYDRGLVSKRTAVELGLDIDFDAEIERRKREQAEGLDQKDYDCTMFPPVVNNIDTQFDPNKNPGGTPAKPKDNVPLDKQGPEKKNSKNL